MKTPKEEAKELIDKFKEYSRYYSDELTTVQEEEGWTMETAKEIALISVDKIIEVLSGNNIFNAGLIEYWQEVKQELNNI